MVTWQGKIAAVDRAVEQSASQLSELIGWYRSPANSSIFTPLFQDPYHIKCQHPAVGHPTCLEGNNEAAASWSQILYFETCLWKSGSKDGLLDLFLGSSLTGWRLLKNIGKKNTSNVVKLIIVSMWVLWVPWKAHYESKPSLFLLIFHIILGYLVLRLFWTLDLHNAIVQIPAFVHNSVARRR